MKARIEELWNDIQRRDEYDNILAHYTSLDIALEKILFKGTLKLGDITKTNDPRESKEWRWLFKNGEKAEAIDGTNLLHNHNDELNILLKKGCKITCFSQNSDFEAETSGAYGGHAWDRPRMWAQYANNHKGVCILFDKEKLVNSAVNQCKLKGRFICSDVVYDKDANYSPIHGFIVDFMEIEKSGVKAVAEKLKTNNLDQLFFRKRQDWQEEHEFRMLLCAKNEYANTEVFIDCVPAIMGVIAGVDCPYEPYLPVIEDYCKRYVIPFGILKWFNGKGDLQGLFFDN